MVFQKKFVKILLIFALILACKSNQDTTIQHLDYEPEYTADQILNNDMARRKPSPIKTIVFDTTGFAKNRLFNVPEIGKHPRILFASSDIPRIKNQLKNTNAGTELFQHVKKLIAIGIDKPGTREYEIFQACINKNNYLIESLWKSDSIKNATSWHHRDAFRISLMLKAWLCLMDGNTKEGKKVADALTGYALFLEPKMDAVNKDPDNNMWWKFGHEIFGWLNASIPFTYDWSYNFMTTKQQSDVRRLLSKVTYGKYNLGMDMPAHWINWNHIGGEMYFPLYALAIEGETGYDPRIYERTVHVARSFLDYGISDKGMSKESIGYHTGGMSHMSIFMIAAANRGDNLFTHPHYRNQIDWYLYRLQPYGKEWVSRGDVGFSEPGPEPLMVHKYFYPRDYKVDYIFRNLGFNQSKQGISSYTDVDTQGIDNETIKMGNFEDDFFMELMLLCPEDPLTDKNGKLIDYEYGKILNEGHSFFDNERGSMSTKTAWGKDELQLQFDCRTDTRFASHDHADRGSFDLSALGRLWTREDSRLIKSKDHSVVLIDGIGQGYFPTFGKWVGFYNNNNATFGACNAKYTYDWQWEKEVKIWSEDDPRLKKSYYKWVKKEISKFDKTGWEYDPSPEIVNYYKNYLDGNPLMWHGEDSWIIRKAYNPVEHAFRTCGLVRGEKPYVLVVDDIKKDTSKHLYEWLMALPKDVSVESMDLDKLNEQDIILKENNGNRKLLVRILNCNNLQDTSMDAYNPNKRNYSELKRLSIRSVAVVPDFKILLYPFQDEEKPITTWDDGKTNLNIIFKTQHDSINFNKSEAGRTIMTLYRNGKEILNTSKNTSL